MIDAGRHTTISSRIVEPIVVDAVKTQLADVEGRASAQSNARQAVAEADRAQADLDAAIRAFAGVADEQATRERIWERLRCRRCGSGSSGSPLSPERDDERESTRRLGRA